MLRFKQQVLLFCPQINNPHEWQTVLNITVFSKLILPVGHTLNSFWKTFKIRTYSAVAISVTPTCPPESVSALKRDSSLYKSTK